jgi:hypothetical protein
MVRALTYILLGGISFWGADALLMPVGTLVPVRVWLIAKSILLPLSVVVVARSIAGKKTTACSPAAKSYLMLTGIWLTGPVYSLLVNRVYYKTIMGPGEAVFTVALFPLSTVVYATYSGALGGLVIASVFLALNGLFTLSRD